MSVRSLHSAALVRVFRFLWLGRVTSPTPRIPPGSLILAAHYNGLVDGFAYGSVMPPAIGVISMQWHRSWIGRALFPGIAVQRAKDGVAKGENLRAFREMTTGLSGGDRLLFFPEGTSRLGTARLPIARGTEVLLRNARRLNPPPAVYFCAAHYHSPTRWKSAISIGWTGPMNLADVAEPDAAWVAENLRAAQAAAYAAPAPRQFHLTAVAALLAAPYLPLWAFVAILARRIADDTNVISLWKLLFGVPLTLIFAIGLTAFAIAAGYGWWWPVASLIGGWLLWNR